MAKLEYWESNRNMFLFLATCNTLYINVTNFRNEGKEEVKFAENSITILSNKWKVKLKYVTDYSNKELVTKRSTIPDFLEHNCVDTINVPVLFVTI